MTESLLDPSFLRRLSGLRLQVRRRLRGTNAGARRSTRRGSSVEFADHRAYTPGDDIRRIDWRAFARLEQLILRLYVAEEDISIHLLIDTSQSLELGDPSKLDVAKRLAAGLGYLSLAHSDRLTVGMFSNGLNDYKYIGRGQKRIGQLLRTLDDLVSEGTTNFERTVFSFLARHPKPGLIIILSDLLDPGGFERPIERLLIEKHEVVLFHILSNEELSPQVGGDLTLVDIETEAKIDLTMSVDIIENYKKKLKAFLEYAESWSRKRGISYIRVEGGDAFEDALIDYLRKRV